MERMKRTDTIEERAQELAEYSHMDLRLGVPGMSPHELLGYGHATDTAFVQIDEDHVFTNEKDEREYWAGWLAGCIVQHDWDELPIGEATSEPPDELPNDEAPAHSHGDGVPCTERHVDPNPHHGGGMAGHDTYWDEDDPERTKLDQDQGP